MFRLWGALILVGIVLPQLRAEERILSWHSDIVVEKSGDVVVTETITVRAERYKISGGSSVPCLSSGKAKGACRPRSVLRSSP